jgi:hypothetical protein
MSQKSPVPQAVSFVSQVLKRNRPNHLSGTRADQTQHHQIATIATSVEAAETLTQTKCSGGASRDFVLLPKRLQKVCQSRRLPITKPDGQGRQLTVYFGCEDHLCGATSILYVNPLHERKNVTLPIIELNSHHISTSSFPTRPLLMLPSGVLFSNAPLIAHAPGSICLCSSQR